VLVSDATTKTINIPAEYKTEKKRVQVKPDKLEWMPVICEEKLTKDTMKKIQGGLVSKGFDLKDVDGIEGEETKAAIYAFQSSLGFKTNGIALKTLEALGVNQ